MLVTLSFFLPLLLTFMYGMRTVRSRQLTAGDAYYNMSQGAKSYQYRDTTVAYTLQIAVTVYFIFWGYKYGWGNILYLVTWWLGLFVFWYYSPKYISYLDNCSTLFRMIELSTSHYFRRVLALLSCGSLFGLAYVELFYGSMFSAEAFSAEASVELKGLWYWVSFAIVAILVAAYTGYGGMARVVFADVAQLSLAYLGSALLLSYLIWMISRNNTTGPLLTIGILSSLVFFLMGYFGSRRVGTKGSSIAAYVAFAMLLLSTILSYVTTPYIGTNTVWPQGLLSQLSESEGWVPLLGFTLANLVWQLSDNTAYFRMTILPRGLNSEEYKNTIKNAIRSTLLTSPLTWGIGIFIGMAIRCSSIDLNGDSPFSGLIKHLASSSLSNPYALVAFVGLGSMLSMVLVSTLDVTLIALCQLVDKDVTNNAISTPLRRTGFTVLLSLLLILCGVAHRYTEMPILTVLSACYSLILAIGPVTLLVLYQRKNINALSFIAVALGVGCAVYVTSRSELSENLAIGLPLIVVVSVSSFICIIGYFVMKPNRP